MNKVGVGGGPTVGCQDNPLPLDPWGLFSNQGGHPCNGFAHNIICINGFIVFSYFLKCSFCGVGVDSRWINRDPCPGVGWMLWETHNRGPDDDAD